MLEKPVLHDATIIACLREEYGLPIVQVDFLPLGADQNTAVYRVVAHDGTPCFLKLRRGDFDEISVALPRLLSDQGMAEIIAPLATTTGKLWAHLAGFTVILYPFVEGQNAYEIDLSDRHWRDFGAVLKRLHTAAVPPALMEHIKREAYVARWRESVKRFMAAADDSAFDDPIARQVVVLLQARRDQILGLVARAEQLAELLQARPPELVVCHADIHAGNILIDTSGVLYLVDWDTVILAPKERDLMFVGAGLFGARRSPQDEEALFYQGYDRTQIDYTALAYYRYERIIQDIAEYCAQLLLTNAGGDDREQSLRYLTANFLPGGTIALACAADTAAHAE